MAEAWALNLFGRDTELQCYLNPQSHHVSHTKVRRPVTKEWNIGLQNKNIQTFMDTDETSYFKVSPPMDAVLLSLKVFN